MILKIVYPFAPIKLTRTVNVEHECSNGILDEVIFIRQHSQKINET
ncbi:MAG: hypothetical protein LBP59_13765 [Planctomycetaceae bacterium]|nr:hypothetical protein [Planctomycetaceae bacterium]